MDDLDLLVETADYLYFSKENQHHISKSRGVVVVVTLISSTNKNDPHDITEILLKVVLNTITLALNLKIKTKFTDKPLHVIIHTSTFLGKIIAYQYSKQFMIPYIVCNQCSYLYLS